ncbi:MAG: pyrroline-5-carboxylate reductase [Alphaproteobacteria bacterium]|nr:pyrroline-5-carboxylate reductase [Alphaproteobacteria bacterium]
MDQVNDRGLVLLGCGKMGSAMLTGWLKAGLRLENTYVLDPYPSDWVQRLAAKGLNLNTDLPASPAICVLAVKPQMMGEALPRLQALGGGDVLFLSIAAGTSIATFEAALGEGTPIIRAMPNTPAAVGHGITALVGSGNVDGAGMDLAARLLSAVGQTVRLEDEAQMDAVTAVSGSGPAYVFHLIETLAAAGVAEGLSADLSMKLALATVAGAGDLAENADENVTQLRVNVTSPGGTTAAALAVLMDDKTGFPPLLKRAVAAAAARGRALGKA